MPEAIPLLTAGPTRPPDAEPKAPPSILAALAKTNPDGTPRSEKVRAADIRQFAESCFEANRWWTVEAITCRKMVAGDQWGIWDNRTNTWISDPEQESDDRTRATENIIEPAIDQAGAEIAKDPPQLKFLAGASEIADQAASEFATKIGSFLQRQHRLDEVYACSGDEVLKVGESWLLVQWRKDRGPRGKVGSEMTVPPQFDETGKVTSGPEFEDKFGLTGDLEFRLIPGEMVAAEPRSKALNARDSIALCMRETISEAELRDRYPDTHQRVQTDGGQQPDSDEASVTRADRSNPSGSGSSFDNADPSKHKQATIYTVWVRATDGFPHGTMVCVSRDTICAEGRNEQYQAEGEQPDLPPRIPFPLFQAVAGKRATSGRGRSRVLNAIGPQQERNEILSKRQDHYALLGNGKLLAPVALQSEFTDQVGQVIRYSHRMMGADTIRYLLPPPMPDYKQGLDSCEDRINNAIGINESTQGQVPFSNTSGRAMDKAQQKDFTRLGPIKSSLFHQFAEGVRLGLRLMRRYATEPRMMMTVGDGQATNLEFFVGAKLASCVDVVPFNDQMLPQDPTARHLAINSAFQTLSTIQDEKMRREAARLMRLQNDEAFLDEIDPHQTKAEENTKLLWANEPVEVEEWDDALTHKAELERFMCSVEWRKRVKAESQDPQFAQVDPMTGMQVPPSKLNSPLYQATMALWQQHAAKMQPAPAAPPMPGQTGMPPMPGAAPEPQGAPQAPSGPAPVAGGQP